MGWGFAAARRWPCGGWLPAAVAEGDSRKNNSTRKKISCWILLLLSPAAVGASLRSPLALRGAAAVVPAPVRGLQPQKPKAIAAKKILLLLWPAEQQNNNTTTASIFPVDGWGFAPLANAPCGGGEPPPPEQPNSRTAEQPNSPNSCRRLRPLPRPPSASVRFRRLPRPEAVYHSAVL